MVYYLGIILFTGLFLWLSHQRLSWAVYLTLAFLPAYLVRFQFFSIPLTLLEIMILILFVIFISKHKLIWLRSFKNNPFIWPILIILIGASISVILSPQLRAALGIYKAYFIEPILFFIILINLFKKEQLSYIFWSLGFSAVYVSLFGFWQYFSGWGVPQAFLTSSGNVDRIVSIFGYPNAIGLYLGPIIILFTGFLFIADKKIYQLLKLLIILISLIAIILAKSEAAVLSIIIVWLLWGIYYKPTRLPTIITIVVGAIIVFTNQLIFDFLQTKLLLQDWSGIIRRHIWQETWAMLKDNPIFGAGLAGYQTKIAPYHANFFEIYLYPHNIFFNFWSELGLLGLFGFIWLGIKFSWLNIKQYFNTKNIINFTLLIVILQMFIHGLVDAPYLKNDLSILFWLIIALYFINQKQSAKIKTS